MNKSIFDFGQYLLFRQSDEESNLKLVLHHTWYDFHHVDPGNHG